MRKSRWAAATGMGSLVLLLAACGGSTSSTTAAGPGSAPAGSGSAPASSATSPTTAAATATSTASSRQTTSPHVTATPHHTAGPQPSSGDQSIPASGTTVMIVQHSSIGYVLAEASGQVVYTYSKDAKGGAPTCTGACAATWLPVTGTPQAGPADTFPGTFAVVKGAGGVEQVTYNGYPLYVLKGAKPYATTGNGQGGLWHVVPLSASDIRS
jgi:predicted lipoprotein with Yx(FWY)xxD motif